VEAERRRTRRADQRVDLAGPLRDETVAELRAAWLGNLVVFVTRTKQLTPEQFLAFRAHASASPWSTRS